MTREEAKSELMQIYMSLSEEKKQALDVLMAQADGEYINGKARNNMDRLISEQKVLDAICKSCSVESKPNKCQYKKGLNGGCLEYETVKAIPSAEPSRDMEEIEEIINCDADAETKCKMISNILTAKPHYFEEPQERSE